MVCAVVALGAVGFCNRIEQVKRNIREYNADMRKTYTDARFAPDDLPRELSIEKLTFQ